MNAIYELLKGYSKRSYIRNENNSNALNTKPLLSTLSINIGNGDEHLLEVY